jgi:hypothetical protein
MPKPNKQHDVAKIELRSELGDQREATHEDMAQDDITQQQGT